MTKSTVPDPIRYNGAKGIAMTNKQLVIEEVSRLPERTSLEEIAERIAILAAIRKGELAADAGRTVPHEKVVRQLKKWIGRGFR
jgi:hypothetical protein